VSAQGTAREIKNRSLYMSNISCKCQDTFKEHFEKVASIYDDGWSFCVNVQTTKTEEEISSFFKAIQKEYLQQDIFPFLAFVKINKDKYSINEMMDAVNKQMQRAKLQRPIIYEKFEAQPVEIPDGFNKLNDKNINAQVPRHENGTPLDFDAIAKKSDGTAKIAALKLDVDHLETLFCNKTDEEYKRLTDGLKHFFNEELKNLIDAGLKQNIYVLFSGLGNCFLIGSWNYIFSLAIKLRDLFDKIQKNLKKEIRSLPENDITLSAGIVVVPPKYPMIRLAEEVENALNASKRTVNKDSITCFGKTIRWNEFKKSQTIAEQLIELVKNRGESQNLIRRIKSSDIGFDNLQQDAHRGKINIPKIWRLKYYLRNVHQQNRLEVENLFNEYTKAVLDAFIKHQTTNPNLYPIAARWAELLLQSN
jgi:CRISPR-associated protein Csm1